MEIVQHFFRGVRYTYQAPVARNRHCVVRSPNIQRVHCIDMRSFFKDDARLRTTGFVKAVRTMTVVGTSERYATVHSMPMTHKCCLQLNLLRTFPRTLQSFMLSACCFTTEHSLLHRPSFISQVQHRLASSPILHGGQSSGTNCPTSKDSTRRQSAFNLVSLSATCGYSLVARSRDVSCLV